VPTPDPPEFRIEFATLTHPLPNVTQDGRSLPVRSATMYWAYQAGQFSSAWPVRASCWPWAAAARTSACSTSLTEAYVVSSVSMRPGRRVVISWSSQVLPSGSPNVANEALRRDDRGVRWRRRRRPHRRQPDHHWPVLDAFPGAQLVACDQRVVDEARGQTTPAAMANWNSRFPGQLSQSPATPALISSQELDLDGHPLLFHTIGGADGVLATIVHLPETQSICSGDIAYNNIHMWLWKSTPDSRQAWLASLDAVAAFKPSTIITGHKDPDAPDDNATRVLDQSRHYIEDFDHTVAKSSTPQEVIDEMLARYPDYGNRYTLFLAALTQFPS
jgi:hypothetical protein